VRGVGCGYLAATSKATKAANEQTSNRTGKNPAEKKERAGNRLAHQAAADSRR
jgi:hypothetical protein